MNIKHKNAEVRGEGGGKRTQKKFKEAEGNKESSNQFSRTEAPRVPQIQIQNH